MFHSVLLGVQIRGGESKSASGYGPRGSKSAGTPGPKLFPRQDIFSRFSGVHTLNFIGPHEEPSNFYGEKRSVAFVTSHLFTFLVVLSLVCLVTTQILICENQTIWRLEILLRTIVTALLKTKDISVTPVVIIALSWLTTESEACDKIF